MSFTFSPIFHCNDLFLFEVKDTILDPLHEEDCVYVFGKRLHFNEPKSSHELARRFCESTITTINKEIKVQLLEYIPISLTHFPQFNRKEFIHNFQLASKFKYTSQLTKKSNGKHALLLIEGDEPFNPVRFQQLETVKIPYFRGSCSFWVLWFAELLEVNPNYTRKFLESYALYKLRKRASEYLSWWIATKLNFFLVIYSQLLKNEHSRIFNIPRRFKCC